MAGEQQQTKTVEQFGPKEESSPYVGLVEVLTVVGIGSIVPGPP